MAVVPCRRAAWAVVLAVFSCCAGCHTIQAQRQAGLCPAPRELSKGILPTYRIEPPDILTVDAIRLVPKASYTLRPMDVVGIHATGTLSDLPLDGEFVVEPGGVIQLGPEYGTLEVTGMTVEQLEHAVHDRLAEIVKEPQVTVSLIQSAPTQQIAGQHLVKPDGTVTLGSYGSVLVVGLTIDEARMAIEQHLAAHFDDVEVAVDVFAYNSKVYYVITQGAGLGDGVYRFPVTGNETVLDAISQINGLSQVSSKRIWVARPGKNRCGENQIFPVDWDAIAQRGEIDTNYQVLPGDRVYVAEDRLIALDTNLAKFTAPLERAMGFSLLGVGTATRFSGQVLRGGGNSRNNF